MEPIFISQFDFRVDQRLVFQEGYPGKIQCSPFAIPLPIFQWNFNEQAIQNGSKYQMWLDGSLHISSVSGADGGDYKCTAQGTGDSESMRFNAVVIREPLPFA